MGPKGIIRNDSFGSSVRRRASSGACPFNGSAVGYSALYSLKVLDDSFGSNVRLRASTRCVPHVLDDSLGSNVRLRASTRSVSFQRKYRMEKLLIHWKY